MTTNKNIVISVVLMGGVLVGVYLWVFGGIKPMSSVVNSPEPSQVESPSATSIPTKSPSATNIVIPVVSPLCQLKGEVKFLDINTYDNQDALFIYSGIDDPARNIMWTVYPQDDIRVGPNIFTKLPVPNGESLLGVFLPENPKYKRYELTAKVQYGKIVDGNVNVLEKQCDGKTVVVLP